MKDYIWRGIQIQIADEDLNLYEGAVPVVPEKKAVKAPANKARKTANKGGESK